MSFTFLGKKNNAHSTLAAPITTTGQLTLQVQSGAHGLFPATAFHGTLYTAAAGIDTGEIVTATYSGSNDIFNIVRAQESTSAQLWPATTTIFAEEITAAQVVELETAINVNAGLIATNTSNIATNTADIATNTSTIATHTSNIATGWVAATGTWTYASWDSATATGTITVPTNATTLYTVGMRVRFTNNSATQYGIITVVAATLLTVYFGTDYSLTNSAITVPFYSPEKVPFGFPISRKKWTQTLTDTSDRTQATPVNGTWYNMGSLTLTVPIGAWILSYKVVGDYQRAASPGEQYITLSTANNSESDTNLTIVSHIGVTGFAEQVWSAYASEDVLTAAATPYYLNSKSGDTLSAMFYLGSGGAPTIITAVSLYL